MASLILTLESARFRLGDSMADRVKANFQRGDNLWTLLDKAGFKPTEIPGYLERIARANGIAVKALNNISSDSRLWIPKKVADELPPGMVEATAAQRRAASEPERRTAWWGALILLLLLAAAYALYGGQG